MDSTNIIGELIAGRYKVTKVLGKGGYGSIYEATDQQFRGVVAIKILNIEKVQPGSRDLSRFENEAQILSKIRHPNVVGVFDFGVHQGWPFIVMERLNGHDLKEEISRGPISSERAFKLFSGALAGLGYAHQRGLIHKDIKPANLFLDVSDGTERLVVVDYGIGVDAGREMQRFTATGAIAGTPSYIPPEYITDAIVSAQNDVYQIALTLVESLTGQKVVDAESTFKILEAHMKGQLSFPDWFRNHEWFDVIMIALSVDLHKRYSTADGFLSALEAVGLPSPSNIDLTAFEQGGSFATPSATLETKADIPSKLPVIVPSPSKKKSGAGKFLTFGCLGIVVLLVLSGVLFAVFSSDIGNEVVKKADGKNVKVGGTKTENKPKESWQKNICPEGGCKQTCSVAGACGYECVGGKCEQICVASAQGCGFFCEGGDCVQKCAAGQTTCTFLCDGGGCEQECPAGKLCVFGCEGGGCEQKCVAGEQCFFNCDGGKCTQSNNKGKLFMPTCKDNNCKVN